MTRLRSMATARSLARRARAAARTRQERRFRSRLRFEADAPALLLSPHLDDAVLDCWALLTDESALRVVDVFAGVPAPGWVAPWDAITGARDSAERVRERLVEDELALRAAGRSAARLGFLDAQYRPAGTTPTLDRLDAALADWVRSASRIYAPAGIGGHADHLVVRRYACLLADRGIPVSLYAELPYCVRHGWPSWVNGREPNPLRDVDAFWAEQLAGVSAMPPLRSARVVVLDREACAAKLAALRCYATQMPALDFAAAGLLEHPATVGFEVSWQLRRR